MYYVICMKMNCLFTQSNPKIIIIHKKNIYHQNTTNIATTILQQQLSCLQIRKTRTLTTTTKQDACPIRLLPHRLSIILAGTITLIYLTYQMRTNKLNFYNYKRQMRKFIGVSCNAKNDTYMQSQQNNNNEMDEWLV